MVYYVYYYACNRAKLQQSRVARPFLPQSPLRLHLKPKNRTHARGHCPSDGLGYVRAQGVRYMQESWSKGASLYT